MTPLAVGVLRETAPHETRVALTPDGVRGLTVAGLPVTVQTGAGERAGFPDAAYRAAGARIAPDADTVCAAADLVAWVKLPRYPLTDLPLRPGSTLLGFQDPHHRADAIAELAARGIRTVAFELVPRTAAEVDALTPMSRIAGGVAYAAARALLPERARERPVRVLLLGFGAAGRAALAAALAAGDAPPVVAGARESTRADALAAGAGGYVVTVDGAATVSALLPRVRPDIVLCAALRRGAPAPVLLDTAGLALLAPGSVVVDLAVKAGGNCVATCRDTTLTLPGGVRVTHRSNYPAAAPAAASSAYSTPVAAMILRLAAGSEPPVFQQL